MTHVERYPICAAIPYDVWKKLVDGLFIDTVGLDTDELPDAPYRDWYEENFSPRQVLVEYAADWDDTGIMMELVGGEA